jgi:hypothetical protein
MASSQGKTMIFSFISRQVRTKTLWDGKFVFQIHETLETIEIILYRECSGIDSTVHAPAWTEKTSLVAPQSKYIAADVGTKKISFPFSHQHSSCNKRRVERANWLLQLSRDFQPLVFSSNNPGPWFTGWSPFAYGIVFAEKIDLKIAKIWSCGVNDTAGSDFFSGFPFNIYVF